MTSTDFTYPQPTDDELAAQQPWNPAPNAPLIYSSPGAGFDHTAGPHEADATNSPTLGRTAMVLSIVAGVLSVVASVILGATVGPAEAASGYYFTDTPDWYQTLAAVLVGLQALCTGLGLTAIVLGIVAAVTDRGRTFAIFAIAAAVIAPFVSFATFVALSFAFA
jgi:vacuolar-type H+-ATPase subunit I/STV1